MSSRRADILAPPITPHGEGLRVSLTSPIGLLTNGTHEVLISRLLDAAASAYRLMTSFARNLADICKVLVIVVSLLSLLLFFMSNRHADENTIRAPPRRMFTQKYTK